MELDGEMTNEGWDFFDGSLKRRHVRVTAEIGAAGWSVARRWRRSCSRVSVAMEFVMLTSEWIFVRALQGLW